VWVKKSPLWCFLTFPANGWEFLVQLLHAYYTFLSTLYYGFFYSIISNCDVSTDCGHFEHKMMWTQWSRLIWHNFVKVAGGDFSTHTVYSVAVNFKKIPTIRKCLKRTRPLLPEDRVLRSTVWQTAANGDKWTVWHVRIITATSKCAGSYINPDQRTVYFMSC